MVSIGAPQGLIDFIGGLYKRHIEQGLAVISQDPEAPEHFFMRYGQSVAIVDDAESFLAVMLNPKNYFMIGTQTVEGELVEPAQWTELDGPSMAAAAGKLAEFACVCPHTFEEDVAEDLVKVAEKVQGKKIKA